MRFIGSFILRAEFRSVVASHPRQSGDPFQGPESVARRFRMSADPKNPEVDLLARVAGGEISPIS
jgi:hypothetical protein